MSTNRHGGNLRQLAEACGRPENEILDFSANINPLGPPEWLRQLISSRVSSLVHYPDPDCTALVRAAATRYGVHEDCVVVGNGSTEIIYTLPRILGASRAVIPVPAYADYATASELAGLAIEPFPIRESDGFALDLAALDSCLHDGEIVFIGQPNNPTGMTCDPSEIRSLARRHPGTTFIIDEAFGDFVDGLDSLTQDRPSNVIVLLSLTKFYAIPGLRLGIAVADPEIAERVRRLIPTWSINTIAQAVGEAALTDAEYASATRQYVSIQRDALLTDLAAIPGLTVYPGQANFLLVRVDRAGMEASDLASGLLKDGIAIRTCANFEGLDSRFLRVAVRTADDNRRLVDSLRRELGAERVPMKKHKTPAVMFQGTSSNAGKSILAAAMCRILLQDGYRVAPFKAQNMSLNSHVTRDGGEMGRAQVVQAQAARLDPDVRMNPILLKPNTDTGSQVIVLGQPVMNMDFRNYIEFKGRSREIVTSTYDELASEYDAMVLEGAGSPAEVNLKRHDIVNMNMARHARSPVLLVGDIDRGGVFASFVGTMEVMEEWERRLIAGFVVNRFRGIESLLKDALDYTERHTGKPTFGVVHYLRDLGLPEEDSVTFKSGDLDGARPSGACVEIAVIDLPHISNFTDFDPLRIEPDVHLRVVRTPSELGNPDAVILPGSKNVIGDLVYLRETGLGRRIADLAGKTELIGICGGFQILGKEIADPYGIESTGKTLQGLGLLPVSTILAREKTLTSVTARHIVSGTTVKGYEIHHGLTDGMALAPTVLREDGETIGAGSEDGMMWGTYLHGIFDADEFRRWFIDRIRARRGLERLVAVQASYDLEPAFDRLADAVRNSLRIDDIYRLMGL